MANALLQSNDYIPDMQVQEQVKEFLSRLT
jgi:hypothetical protein